MLQRPPANVVVICCAFWSGAHPPLAASASGASRMQPTNKRLTHKRSSARWVRPGGRRECTFHILTSRTSNRVKEENTCCSRIFFSAYQVLPPHQPLPRLLLFEVISCFRAQETVHLDCVWVQICFLFISMFRSVSSSRWVQMNWFEGVWLNLALTFDLRIRGVKGLAAGARRTKSLRKPLYRNLEEEAALLATPTSAMSQQVPKEPELWEKQS